MLIPYNNGIQIAKIKSETLKRIKLVEKQKKDMTPKSKPYKKSKLEAISKKDIDIATFELYTSIIPDTFKDIIETIIKNNISNDVYKFVADCLYRQGVLIKKTEIPDAKNINNNQYIGYVDIFQTEYKPYLLSNKNVYRELTANELTLLMKNRKLDSKPQDMSKETKTWGMITPIVNKKDKTYKNIFKIFTPGPSKGAKTGIDCLSLLKKTQEQILNENNVQEEYETKQQNCKQIAVQLIKNNRMILYPEYKPK